MARYKCTVCGYVDDESKEGKKWERLTEGWTCKTLALGADAVAISTAALIAIGCQQYRICNIGRCPIGITSQDPEFRRRLKIEQSAKRLENFLRTSTEELKLFARFTGNDDVHQLAIADVSTGNSEMSSHAGLDHV